jgi:Domain of unknown function (DUF4214)
VPKVTTSGTLPSVIVENATASGWAGSLTLTGDLADLTGIELVGAGASYFSVSFDPLHSLAILTPAALVDYEAFRFTGLDPVLNFSLVFDFDDGSQQVDSTIRHVTVLNVDDTPPSAVAFSSGGNVMAGAIGAVIGTLRVTDVETTGPFYYTFDDNDAWRFEVVGNTLKLKDGISLGLDDVGTFQVPIEVSDGVQSAAFMLTITVNAPGGQPDTIHFLNPGDFTDLFWFDSANSVSSLRCSYEVSYVENYGQGVRDLVLRDGTALWLPSQVQEIHFADGWMDLRPDGAGAEVLALYQTILQREPDPFGYANVVKLLEGGMSFFDLTAAFLQSPEYIARIGNPDDVTFITDLYRDALGRAPDPSGFDFQMARLASGISRTQMVDDFIMSQESLTKLAAQHPDGYWIVNPYGKEVAMVYEVALGREVDVLGLADWTAKLASGQLTPTQLAGLIGGSQEYLSRYAPLSDADFVTAMYENALHREPDPQGFADWTSALANHTVSRSDLVNAFAFSAENYGIFGQHPSGLDMYYA